MREEIKPSYTAVGNVKSCSHYGKSLAVPQKVNVELYDPVIPLPGIHPKELKRSFQTKTYTKMFIAALFILAKRWELSKARWLMNAQRKWGPSVQPGVTDPYRGMKHWHRLRCGGPWKLDAKWTKSDTERPHTVWSLLQEMCRMGTSLEAESKVVIVRSGRGLLNRTGAGEWPWCTTLWLY